jgi:ABC-type phosphate/phosphonate transport system permease subunit
MGFLKRAYLWIVTSFLIFLPQITLAADVAKKKLSKKAPIIWVADTRNATGFWGWTTSMYNENIYLYGLLTIILMAIWGVILGAIMDFIMMRSGIELTKRELRE